MKSFSLDNKSNHTHNTTMAHHLTTHIARELNTRSEYSYQVGRDFKVNSEALVEILKYLLVIKEHHLTNTEIGKLFSVAGKAGIPRESLHKLFGWSKFDVQLSRQPNPPSYITNYINAWFCGDALMDYYRMTADPYDNMRYLLPFTPFRRYNVRTNQEVYLILMKFFKDEPIFHWRSEIKDYKQKTPAQLLTACRKAGMRWQDAMINFAFMSVTNVPFYEWFDKDHTDEELAPDMVKGISAYFDLG